MSGWPKRKQNQMKVCHPLNMPVPCEKRSIQNVYLYAP